MRDSVSDVLKAIATNGPISRAQLARELGLSGPTLTQATRHLIERGLVHEVEQAQSTGGRPATLLGLIPGAGKVLGVKLAEDHLVGVCVDLESQIHWSFEEKFSSRGEQAIADLRATLKQQIKRAKGQILGIGIGIPGVITSIDSVTAHSAILGWDGLNVGDNLSRELGIPVILENDVNTLAVTESLYGRGKDFSNFLTITLGRGIGLGIVINGELYNGTNGAGEFGHTKVSGTNIQCECGKNGCLETLAAEPYIKVAAQKIHVISNSDSASKLYEIASKDKSIAKSIFEKPGAALGTAIANVVNVLGPELILISGEGSEAWNIWQPFVEKAIRENVVSTLSKFSIEVDPWDDKKWAMGAASLVLQASLSRTSLNVPALQAVKNRLKVIPGQVAV